MQYVPLHLHTENSLLDGAIRIKELCKFAKENDMPAVAITDHGNMYGAIQMYEEASLLSGVNFMYTTETLQRKIPQKRTPGTLCLLQKTRQGTKTL